MCFVNLLYRSTVPPSPITVFQRGSTCPTNFIIPSSSLIPMSASTKLSYHALYGNQTGTAIVDSQTVNLVILFHIIILRITVIDVLIAFFIWFKNRIW